MSVMRKEKRECMREIEVVTCERKLGSSKTSYLTLRFDAMFHNYIILTLCCCALFSDENMLRNLRDM